MSVLAYVFAVIGIALILALGGVICESEALSDKLSAAKKYFGAFMKVVLFALMIPAFVIFRAACAMGFNEKEQV